MTDSEVFEAWLTPRRGKICPPHPEDYWEVWQAALAYERAKQAEPKFAHVYCSQCGGEFGPGNHGYSHCKDHAAQVDPVAFGHDGKPWPHTIDAKAWADEFCKRNTATDHGTMIGWFANAIEFARAHDAAPTAVQQTEPVDVTRDPRVLLAACLLHPLPLALANAIKEILAAPPADDEAVRLLRKARYMCDDSDTFTRMALAKAIDAYLAKVGK